MDLFIKHIHGVNTFIDIVEIKHFIHFVISAVILLHVKPNPLG